jgi:hypothetical protein
MTVVLGSMQSLITAIKVSAVLSVTGMRKGAGMSGTTVSLLLTRTSESQGMGGYRAAALQNRRDQYTKNTGFVDVRVSKVLRDFPISRNQPLKTADDYTLEV